MTHLCHAEGCDVQVEPSLLMCRRHWYMVPPRLRCHVWAEYRRGQEQTKNPSLRYLAVAHAAVALVAYAEGTKSSNAELVERAALAREKAERCIELCRIKDLGNPLVDIDLNWPERQAPAQLTLDWQTGGNHARA